MWNDNFELPDGSYSVSDIKNYFEYITKKYEMFAENPPIRIYVNKTDNRITFKTKNEYYLEILARETVKLLGSTENGKNVPHSEITEVILVHCNIVVCFADQTSKLLEIEDEINLLSHKIINLFQNALFK